MVAGHSPWRLWLIAGLSAEAAADPVIMAAGDIACDPTDPGYNGGAGSADRCHQQATSDLLLSTPLDAVLPLGDIQYDSASTARINAVYAPTWGRVKSITRPDPGQPRERRRDGYFDYFNGPGVRMAPAGPRGKGYYSFDLGAWHLVALNSNCCERSCSAGSAAGDLAAGRSRRAPDQLHARLLASPALTARGTMAATSSCRRSGRRFRTRRAEVLLSGHSHDYERFAPLDRDGAVDRAEAFASSWSAPAVRSSQVAWARWRHTARLRRTTRSGS